MTISRIRNTVLRRTVLVVTFIPLLLLTISIGFWDFIKELAADLPSAIRVAWKGQQ